MRSEAADTGKVVSLEQFRSKRPKDKERARPPGQDEVFQKLAYHLWMAAKLLQSRS